MVDLFTYEGAQAQELAINAVKHCLQEVSLAGIFTVKQLQQLMKKTEEKDIIMTECVEQTASREERPCTD